jgi:hypothetical protein
MRGAIMFVALTALVGGAVGCGHETRTVVRRETVQTETVPAPVVERHTIIEAPAVPQERVIEQRRTVIEHE